MKYLLNTKYTMNVQFQPAPDAPAGTRAVETSTGKFLRDVVTSNNAGRGLTTDDIIMAVKVSEQIDKGPDVIALEDAQWEHCRTKVNAFAWAFFDPAMAQFVMQVREPLTEPPKQE